MPPTTFFCALCAKGYARAPELEAHENSYDHQHKKRLKEMRAMTRNPTAAVASSRAEKRRRENSEMISVNLQDATAPRGKEQQQQQQQRAGSALAGDRGFRPIGNARDPAREEEESVGRKQSAEDEVEKGTVEGPIPWEKLGELDELVDTSLMRPKEVQNIVDRLEAHRAARQDGGFSEDVWRRVDEMRGKGGTSVSPPAEERMGLGA